MVLRRLALLLFVVSCVAMVAPAAADDTHLAQHLAKVLGEKVHYAQLSPEGAYAAVVLEKDLALTTAAGKVIWRRPRTAVNRYLSGLGLTATAAPGGKLFAVAGGESFRKVLLLDAHGHSLEYLTTRGTPEGLAFDHRGKRLAVGTAGNWIYVVSLASSFASPPLPLRAFRNDAVHSLKLNGIFAELSYSPDDRFLATGFSGYTSALLTGSGTLVWSREVQEDNTYAMLRPSKDWRWFTHFEFPSHGPFFGTLSLLSRSGKKLWSVPYRDAQAAVSPDNHFVLMRAGPDEYREDMEKQPPVEWRVTDWKGHELPRSGKGDNVRFRAPGGIVLRIRDRTWTATRHGRVLWTMRTEFYGPEFG